MARAKAARTAPRKTRGRPRMRVTAKTKAMTEAKADAISLLKGDHRTVEKLFAQYEKVGDGGADKRGLARRICRELIVHTMLEEEIFYAAARAAGVEDDMLDEAQVEHDGAKVMIADLLHDSPDNGFYDAKVSVLSEYIKHHVREEEKAGGIFAKARKAGLDTAAVGARLQARKTELTQGEESPEREPLRTISLHLQDIHPIPQENTMSRNGNNTRDRDDQGRFMSDDDDGRGRSSSSGRYMSSRGSRSRDDDYDDDRGGSRGRGNGNLERDDQGRFMSDDDDDRGGRSRGMSSRGSRSRDDDYDDDRGGSRGNGNRERDDQGRFMSDDDDDRGSRGGRSSWSSYDDDDDRGGRGRSSGGRSSSGSSSGRSGHGGWFGDSEGHSQAARQRSQGRSSGARYDSGDDDDRSSRGRSSSGGRGHGGWFGDPEGHSEASERGWESRQGSSRSRSSRDDDDGDRGSRSRGRSESSRSSRSSSSGHGGWFGDPQGHAEASRRGWQHRD